MCVLVVGSVATDDIRTPAGEAKGVLGGSASYFSLSAGHLASVRIVAVVGDDFPNVHLELLERRGIGIDGIERRPGESFFWSGSYSDDLKTATTHETRLGVFEQFDPVLTERDRMSPFLFLANIDPILQLRVLDQMSDARLVVLDTMNLWIDIRRDALDEVLRRVDVAVLNDEELTMLTGDHHLVRAARRLLDRGLTAIVVKKGQHGAFLAARDDYFSLPAYPTDVVVDPTGAGDSFAGGFVGYLSRCRRTDAPALRAAVAFGTAMASFSVEAFSVNRLCEIDEEKILQRVATLNDISSFSF